MSDGERDSVPMLFDTHPPAGRRDRDVELRRFTARSATMVSPSPAASGGEDTGSSFYDHRGVMFHTGPLMRSPAAAQFVPMSGPLYGGRHRGTPTPRCEASGSTVHDAGHGNVVFHTGPLTRSPAAAQFVPMSGPLYGGGYRGTPTPPSWPPRLPPLPPPEKPDGGPPEVVTEAMDVGGWAVDEGGYGAGRKDYLLNSGQLGMCNNPYCTTCPGAYHAGAASPRRQYGASTSLESRLHNILYEDARDWARKYFSFVNSSFPIMNPHTKVVQQWNKFFVISCLIAIFIDPLFFFVLSADETHKCIVFDSPFAIAIAVVRTITDFIYLLHMLLQFRLAYVAPESRVVGAGDFVVEPKKIARHYLRGYFLLDLFVALPLPQVMILVVIPAYLGSSAANYAKNLLRTTVLLQYIPRIVRVLPLLVGQSSSGFIFESAWTNFVINLLMFMLAGHVVGSCWYLFGLQRVNQCLRDACSDLESQVCRKFMDCGSGSNINAFSSQSAWKNWTQNSNATSCFSEDRSSFYGIYLQAALITKKRSIVDRYIYSLFWGFQQISTLAGNQTPSAFVWEVLFTMGIVGLGLLLFALLIGNIQNFLQALGRRSLEMQLRRRDVEQWMSHRRLPEVLRRQVRQAERFNWAATRGVNEEELLENLPEDLQRDVRRHLFKFLKKVRIFYLMDEPILDAVRERLRQKLYIAGSYIQYQGGPIEKMVFIVRGKMESIGADGNAAPLSEGDVCGEELLAWYLEHSSLNKDGGKIRFPGQRLFSNRMVKCVTNVEAFALQSDDLEDVTAHFARFLRNPRVQGAIRYESPYWRTLAATRIQVAWRYRKRRLHRTDTSQ